MKFFSFLLSIILYRLSLDINYLTVIQEVFGYRGFSTYYSIQSLNNIATYFILILTSRFVYKFLKTKSSFVSSLIFFIFLFRFIPLTSIIGLVNTPILFATLEYLYMFFILLFAYKFTKKRDKNNPYKLHVNYALLNVVVIICAIIVIAISGIYAGFRLNFSLYNVYDLRLEIREFNIPSLVGYFWTPIGNILPITLILYLIKKNFKMCIFIAFIIFLNFSIDGMKANIFKLFVVILFYFYYNEKLLFKLPYIVTSIVFLATVEYFMFNSFSISTFLTYRTLYFPCLLDTAYFDYIYNNGPLFFTMRDEINFAIGGIYFGHSTMRANNGLFSDAFMNLGYLGILIYPLIYSILLRICDKIFLHLNSALVIFVSFIIYNLINSTTLTVALITHGILILVITIYYITYSKKSEQTRLL